MAKPNKPTNPRWNVGSPEPPPPPSVVGVTVSWSAPTTNTDGSPLTGSNAISHYRLAWYSGGAFVNSLITTNTTATVTGLAPGTYTFTVTTVAVDGEESAPYQIPGSKVIA
jgi:predicted phage tail protein